MHNQNVGRLGERRAEEYYRKNNFTILHKNFRTPFGEIDLICQKQNLLVFVEVKCRSSKLYGTPEEAITKKKLNKLQKSIAYFQVIYSSCQNIRVDVVSILLSCRSGEVENLTIYENVDV